MLNLSYKKFSAKKRIFQNFETSISFALFEYRCLHMVICLTAKKSLQRMFGGTKTLSVSKITSKRMTLPLQKSPINKGHDMSLSSTPGAVRSRFQQIFHYPVNLGQSGQDFNKSFKVQLTWGSPVKISTNLSKFS